MQTTSQDNEKVYYFEISVEDELGDNVIVFPIVHATKTDIGNQVASIYETIERGDQFKDLTTIKITKLKC